MPLQLDRAAALPLQDQLYEQLRQLILTSRLKPNTRIIATRFLAEQVGVSRRTVLFAYERLIAEGYLETRPAIGTYVSPTPPDHCRPASAGLADLQRQSCLYPTLISPPGIVPSSSDIDFTPSQINSASALPPRVWLRCVRDVVADDPTILQRPGAPAGLDALRRVIVDYLAATRGILASPEQVVIVTGQRHAASLVAALFLQRGDRVVVESPGDKVVAGIFQAHDTEVVRVPVDEAGLRTDDLPSGRASLAYVTPARQNPTGGVMPSSRRLALITWARDAGAYVIEDDSDADLRYLGAPLPPLVTLDPYGLTFHTGSFAKRLGTGMCLGYLLAPTEFGDALAAIKSMTMEGGQLVEQVIMTTLLASGDYDHHLRRLRKVYLQRRDALIEALRSRFGTIRLIGADAGTQLTWLLPEGSPSASMLCQAVLARGVAIECVAGESGGAFRDKALIFAYAALEPEVARRGVDILAQVYEELRATADCK